MQYLGKVALISKNVELEKAVSDGLRDARLDVRSFSDENQVQVALDDGDVSLVLVDTSIGRELAVYCCNSLKKNAARPMGIIAIIEESTDMVDELMDAAVDDILLAPFSSYSLVARVKSQLKRVDTAEKLAFKVRDSWTLIDITSKLVGTGDLLESLYDMIYILSKELEVDRGSVVLVRPEGDFGLVIASSDDPGIQDLVINLNGYPEIKRVLRKKEPLIVNDVSDSEVLEDVLPTLKSIRIESVALFPIIEDEKVLGVIFLRYVHKRSSFDQRELVFCQTVANATAIALRNHEILESLRQKDQQIEQVQIEARSRLAALKPYEDFFQRSVDGIVVLSDTGVVLFINPEGAALLGRPQKEVRGVPLSKFLHARERDRIEALIEESERGRKVAVDLTIGRQDSSEKIVSTSGTMLGDEGMTLLTMRDVTDERHMAKRLIEAQEQLIENEKQTAIMEVAGAAAHEMNQPLTSVLTSIAMFRRLLRDMPDAPIRLLETMEQEVERMASIIRRLAKLTEYTTKEYVGEAKIIDLERASGDRKSETEIDE